MKLKRAIRASTCEAKRHLSSRSHSRVAKKLSHRALSQASPTEPLEGRTPASLQRLPKASEVYCLPPAFAGAGLYGVGSVKRDFSIRGELAVVHANARYTLVFGRSDRPRP